MKRWWLIKKAQKVLYISLGHDWGSRERGMLRDMAILKKEGRTPFLYCYKNSFVDLEAGKMAIVTIHPNKKLSGYFRWRILFALSPVIRQFDIDLIHLYQMRFVWPLCCFLYRFIEIPLVVTRCGSVDKLYTNVFYRTLVYRVDLFITPLEGIKQNIASHLMVRLRKIACCGMAPLFSNIVDCSESVGREEKKALLMGVFSNGEKSEEEQARILFQGLAIFNERMDCSIRLELISEYPWEKNPLYPFYKKLSWEYQVGDWISFKQNDSMVKNKFHFDLWLGLSRREDLEDRTIWAVFCGIPILIPRTAASMEFFESFGKSGEYYKSGDGREFWQKGLGVLQDIDFYKSEVKKISKKVKKSCDAQIYGKRLLELYDGLKTRRWAYEGRASRYSRT